LKKLSLILIVAVWAFAVDATMEIIKNVDKLPKIMVKDLTDKSLQTHSSKIYNLINSDLKISGHFDVQVDQEHNEIFENTALQALGYNLFLKIKLEPITDDGINVTMELIDLNLDSTVATKSYSVQRIAKTPFIAHQIAIDVNKYIEAPSIDWMNRYVIFAKYTSPKFSEIIISDYTLSYQQTVIKGGLNLFPKWANQDQVEFYYTSLNGDVPTLYRVNLFTGEKQKVYESSGMIVCSDVSDDGNKLLLTMAPFDQPDIYMMDLRSKSVQRVTNYKGIDVNAQFVEDDTKVVFVSDRFNTPNIFAKSLYGGGVEKLVDYGKNNSSCTTFDNYIAFSSKESNNEFGANNFNLYLISTQTTMARRLTLKGLNQFPKFSADGQTLLFLKKYKNSSSLGILRLQTNRSFLFPLKINNIQSIDW
jgi:TolB protein